MKGMESTAESFYVIVFLCAVVGLVCSLVAEPRRRKKDPNTKPYTWALFQAYTAIAFSSLILIIGTWALFSAEFEVTLGSLFIGVPLFWVALNVVRRRRWAWVTLTFLSLNPVNWTIGYFYGSNRWNELASFKLRRAQKPPSADDDEAARLDRLRKSGALTENEYQTLRNGSGRSGH
jgi:hypothetical protein